MSAVRYEQGDMHNRIPRFLILAIAAAVVVVCVCVRCLRWEVCLGQVQAGGTFSLCPVPIRLEAGESRRAATGRALSPRAHMKELR